jgi:spermidine synthase
MPLRSNPLLGLYALSGFCTLTLETVWMREVSLRAGNTVVAAALVIVAFFAAAALGNLWGARLVQRAEKPLLLYGLFEIAAGAVATLTFLASHWMGNSGATWLIALLLVGPPCFLSGIAFPSLSEAFVPSSDRRTACGGLFYGANLLGAALGIAAGSVLLPWWIGVKTAFTVAAVAQVAGGLIALWVGRERAGSESRPDQTASPQRGRLPPWLGWSVLGASGLLSLAVQALLILWVRQVLQGSVYAIAGVLSTFIGGLGLGALAAAVFRRRDWRPTTLLAVFAALCAMQLFLLPAAGEWLLSRQIAFTQTAPPAMLAQALGWCAMWLLPLTTCLGGVFPVAWELVGGGSARQGSVMGSALAVNKLGSAAGAVAGTFALMPLLGLAHGTCALGWAYAALAVAMLATPGRPQWPAVGVIVVATVLGLWHTARSHPALGILPAEKVLASYSGPYGPVVVAENAETKSRIILLNSRQRLSGTQRALSPQQHESWVPLMFCRRPDRVVTIGAASGISATAALDFPVKELVAVELVPEVARAAREQFGPWNAPLFSDPRARLEIGDGRVVLARLPGQFDAVICDLLFPNEDGTANLYSREFFRTVFGRLAPAGVFCLWLPCHQHDAETAGVVIRTFLGVFQNAVVVRASLDPIQPIIGLLGSNRPLPVSRDFLMAQLSSPAGRAVAAKSLFFRSPEHTWLLLAGDLRAADPGFGQGPVSTDDRPLFAFIGPKPPAAGGRLVGRPFLDWVGRRFVRPLYPSCDLGATPPDDLLGAVRAGNFYFAAAIARSVLPGDTRDEATRLRQAQTYLQRAHALCPKATLTPESLDQ